MSFINQDWDFPKLEELIEARGDKVIYETGVACTCRNDDALSSFNDKDGSPAFSRKLICSICQGDGLIFRNAIIINGLLTAVNPGANRHLMEAGYAVPGDAIFSPSFNAPVIGDFDRITMLNSVPISEGQVIVRGAGDTGYNKVLDTRLVPTEDRLWYLADQAIHCEDSEGVVYTQNVDFELVDKVVRWIGNKPKKGNVYTLKYTAFLEWITYASPFERFDRNRSLAQRVLLRKKHVYLANGSPADTAVKRKQEEDVFTLKTTL